MVPVLPVQVAILRWVVWRFLDLVQVAIPKRKRKELTSTGVVELVAVVPGIRDRGGGRLRRCYGALWCYGYSDGKAQKRGAADGQGDRRRRLKGSLSQSSESQGLTRDRWCPEGSAVADW